MPLAAASCARCTQLETSSLALSLTCMPCCGPAHGMASESIQTGIHMPSQPGCPLTSTHISNYSPLLYQKLLMLARLRHHCKQHCYP